MTTANLIEIFCILDEFCKYFTPELKKHLVDTSCKRRRNRPCSLSDSEVMTILVLFLQTCALGKCTGISIIDSTPLVSCHIKRMHMHKTMKGWAAKGKCTMGWFYGFKLHLVINDKGEFRSSSKGCQDRPLLYDSSPINWNLLDCFFEKTPNSLP